MTASAQGTAGEGEGAPNETIPPEESPELTSSDNEPAGPDVIDPDAPPGGLPA